MPQITWFREGIELSPAFERAHIKKTASDSTLCIEHVRAEHTGAYAVKLSSPIGLAEAHGRIDFLDDDPSPRFVSALPLELVVVLGEPVILGVVLAGQPLPEATWMKVPHQCLSTVCWTTCTDLFRGRLFSLMELIYFQFYANE